ncbi:MAG: type II toxin-antitoxin system prevent-host-death family antitoxin [Chloroflexi bacterium]|nr:type II toxin-antitoxin system prevent-host-death family antitoxin [Chloroflexota bacterium]
METVGAFEAKTHLSRLLEEVAKGQSITITKRGVPVAVLVPPSAVSRPDRGEAVDRMAQFQEEHRLTLGGLSLRELIEEGRR